MQRLIAVTALAIALSACSPRQNAEAPPQAPAPLPPAPTPQPAPATDAFYIGRWARSEADCPAKAWSITQNALTAPEGSCAFDTVAPIPEGFAVEASCQWAGKPVHASMRLSYAQSAKALLISGSPAGDIGLIACPAANPQTP
jgi:hypothetical protein